MNQIVLKITDVNRNVLVNASRILSYLNRFFIKYMNSMQYCEDLEDGFLFIFRDMDALKYRTKPIKPELLKEVKPSRLPRVNFFKYFFVSKKNFPAQGVNLQVDVVSGPPEGVMPLVKNFILSVDKGISFKELTPSKLNFHISTYSIIQNYINSLINRFYIR